MGSEGDIMALLVVVNGGGGLVSALGRGGFEVLIGDTAGVVMNGVFAWL